MDNRIVDSMAMNLTESPKPYRQEALRLAMKLTLSTEAKVKLKERRISLKTVFEVVLALQLRFYDIASRAPISIARIPQYEMGIHLVVVYRRKDDSFHIVTAYPVKDISNEVRRKPKGGRWMPTSAEGHL